MTPDLDPSTLTTRTLNEIHDATNDAAARRDIKAELAWREAELAWRATPPALRQLQEERRLAGIFPGKSDL